MWIPVFLLAFIGLFFLGPLGVILGAFLGLLIGKHLSPGLFQVHISSEQQLYAQQVFFRTTFIVMGRLTKADGCINEKEIQQATQLMNNMQLSYAQRQKAIDFFNEGKSSIIDLTEVLLEFKQKVTSPNLIHVFLEIQLQAAYVDGELSSAEELILSNICYILNISCFSFEMIKKRVQSQYSFYQHHNKYQYSSEFSLNQAYSILGVNSQGTDQEIKRAYRKQMSEHHPDKLVSKGLPKEMLDIAKKKTQKIHAAYDLIQKHRKQ